ncbi:glycosyltransferase family 4 protein [Caldicoprobacter faecalis]|uniref:Glycosyltransferase involved in cell wall bisynthesis n=1 Tax=Caldicoprobacter faecalis TaxID=937334 RepID=A0A1I5Y6M0_9FIRM|nr:glycosyltransferase family 4 protein [Caldicoprobacter faecalis]SFQ39856.1 Glycosyltransferase involved in cell wall bisynthesis [Caldicoprobacter faecalis]
MKYSFAFIGSVSTEKNLGGETVKNQLITKYFIENGIQVYVIDVEAYKPYTVRNRIALFLRILSVFLSRNVKSVIISKSYSGAIKILKLAKCFNIFKKRVYYVVIGGTIVRKVRENPNLNKLLKAVTRIYVEGKTMARDLITLGIRNVEWLPNFKEIPEIREVKKRTPRIPLRAVFVSRMTKEKGVLFLLECLDEINSQNVKITIDFYGPFENIEFKEMFFEKIRNSNYAFYQGVLDFQSENAYTKLAEYDLFIFPTCWVGEGFPGALIDAMIAGLPIVASDAGFNGEIVTDEIGYLFKTNDKENFKDVLLRVLDDPQQLVEKSKNAMAQATKYDYKQVLKTLCRDIMRE